ALHGRIVDGDLEVGLVGTVALAQTPFDFLAALFNYFTQSLLNQRQQHISRVRQFNRQIKGMGATEFIWADDGLSVAVFDNRYRLSAVYQLFVLRNCANAELRQFVAKGGPFRQWPTPAP